MRELILHCQAGEEDTMTVRSITDDGGELYMAISHEARGTPCVFLSKDSAQQLADYLTAWLGEAK